MIKLWHCHQARSLRPLWALQEMELEYELEVLPFPPRMFQKEYLAVNPLGTVPYLVDGDTPGAAGRVFRLTDKALALADPLLRRSRATG